MSQLLSPAKFPPPVDSAAVAADWRRRGFGCALWVDPPGQEWIGFVHSANELVTVVEGRLWLSVGDLAFELGPGDEALIPKGAVHTVRNLHPGTARWLYGYD